MDNLVITDSYPYGLHKPYFNEEAKLKIELINLKQCRLWQIEGFDNNRIIIISTFSIPMPK